MSPSTSVSSAPGMHGAIRSMSVSTAHARSMGVCTVNSWASSMRIPPEAALDVIIMTATGPAGRRIPDPGAPMPV
jgi:hypothetical protein